MARSTEVGPRRGSDALLEDDRDALALTASENADLCSGCIRCCSYITVEIDVPRAAWEYDQWIWALHHTGIGLYVERPERWFLYVETRCRRLDEHGRCSIYGRHPVLCREYDPRSCERRLPLADVRAWFHDADELEAWLQRSRPAHWRRLMAYRQDRVEAPAGAPGTTPVSGLVTLETLMASGGRGTGRRVRT